MGDSPPQPFLEPTGVPTEIRPAARLVWAALPVQVVGTGFVTWIAIAFLSAVGGTFTEGLQVIGFAVFSTPLTVAAFVLGLPLRLVPRLRTWWLRHAGWFALSLALAVLLLCLSYFVGGAAPVHYESTEAWPATDGYMPDIPLFEAALGLLALASMHLLPWKWSRLAAA